MPYISPTALIILDGLGISSEKKYNAFYQAKTPHLDRWKHQHFYTTLYAAEKFVGLAQGYNGNSEVGHFTLGAGRIIQQSSTLLNVELHPDKLYKNLTLTKILKNFNKSKTVHLMGMASNGNIHSNLEHARALISTLAKHNISRILIHAFLDGRDTPPQSAAKYLDILQADLNALSYGKIASIHGRHYAMDRNKNWDRTEKTFAILTQQQSSWMNYAECIEEQYKQGIFDEFIIPTACIENHTIQPGDGVIFFNFRPDRAIQLTTKLQNLDLDFVITPLLYHKSLPTTPLIKAVNAKQTLLEVLDTEKKKIFTIAETEKYAHVTYFFNGHRDVNFSTEQRVLIPSNRTCEPAYDPHMQAKKITQTVLHSLQKNPADFYLINYANADMVGHSGNLPATVQAIEYIDHELSKIYHEIVVKQHGTMYITADHGNAEMMFDKQIHQACTSHTRNPVPLYALSKNITYKRLISLADVAPFILENMNIQPPKVMTGTKL